MMANPVLGSDLMGVKSHLRARGGGSSPEYHVCLGRPAVRPHRPDAAWGGATMVLAVISGYDSSVAWEVL